VKGESAILGEVFLSSWKKGQLGEVEGFVKGGGDSDDRRDILLGITDCLAKSRIKRCLSLLAKDEYKITKEAWIVNRITGKEKPSK